MMVLYQILRMYSNVVLIRSLYVAILMEYMVLLRSICIPFERFVALDMPFFVGHMPSV